MFKKKYSILLFLFFVTLNILAQEDDRLILDSKSTVRESIDFNALAPAKAGFYSAVLPGLGQAYNKRYWKIPLVYGALGTGIYFYHRNSKQYRRYRKAFKLRKYGLKDEFTSDDGVELLPINVLERAQRYYVKQRDLSLLITIGLYILQIVEASVDAHLIHHNVNDNLSFEPTIYNEPIGQNNVFAMSLNISF